MGGGGLGSKGAGHHPSMWCCAAPWHVALGIATFPTEVAHPPGSTWIPPLSGFRTATLATSLDTCAFPNPFKSNCNVTAGRTVAFETDQSCQVSPSFHGRAMLYQSAPTEAWTAVG